MNDVINIIGLSLLGSVAGLLGGVIFLVKKNWAKKLGDYAVPFAAGVLISVSLLDLLPEAVEEYGEGTYLVVLLAILVSFFFEQFFASLHHHEHGDHSHQKHIKSIPLILVGDTIHNFIDGVAIAAAYMVEPAFGLLVAIATFLHETPHEIGDFGILLKTGWSNAKVFKANLFSALATLPGALLVLYLGKEAHEQIGILLAIAAGMFLYLGASDFLPEVGEESGGKTNLSRFILLLVGVGIVYLMTLSPLGH